MDPSLGRALVLVHHTDDMHVDSYWPMQNNMTVFGFGRLGLQKHMTLVPDRFTIALLETTDFKTIQAFAREYQAQRDGGATTIRTAPPRFALRPRLRTPLRTVP